MAARRPRGPRRGDLLAAFVLDNRLVRTLVLPSGLPQALSRHCAEEYANLAVLLPELYARFD